MRVKYKGKFREALLDYINDQPWMFELDACGMQFEELPVAMQWGVVGDFADGLKVTVQVDLDGDYDKNYWYDWWVTDMNTVKIVKEGCRLKERSKALKECIEEFQEWYNRQEQ